MSPVFRHGRLRLYLLKLLDESPRHGYEVIRLLQDRFLGVYSPSPGTIYPRLARLEEDGLVTHTEVDGKKVYSITDKGREEIRSRLSDLADLEDELTESLKDVAKEISEDVRDTVRGIREELAAAAREFRGQHGDRTSRDNAGGAAARDSGAESPFGSDEARRIREEARRTREEMRAKFRAKSRDRTGAGWSAPWSAWAEESDASGPDQRASWNAPFSDLERMAIQFANELRAAARQAGDVGERSLSDLRDILTDTLAKVRVEVFTEGDGSAAKPGHDDDGQPGGPVSDGDR